MTYAEEAAHRAIDGARRCEFAAGGKHSEACRAAAKAIDAAIKATAEAIGPCGHPSCDRFGDYDGCLRIRALAAPPAGVGAEAAHVWVKPTMEGGWTCTLEARGRESVKCERKAVVFCEEDHGNGTCLEGRCREHAPAGTGGRR